MSEAPRPESAAATPGEGGSQARGPLAYMAANSVAANLLMFLMMAGGLLILPYVKQELFPEVELEIVNITVPYPGASPEEVEEGILLALEEAVRSLDGVKQVVSTAREGSGSVMVEILSDAHTPTVRNEIEKAIGRLTSLPVDAERPIIAEASRRQRILEVIIAGDLDERSLRELAETFRDELLMSPDITLIELNNVRPPEITIELNQAALHAYGLTFEQVAQNVAQSSIDLPAGGIKSPGGEILLRTTEKRDFGSDFEEAILLSRDDGTQIRLRDVATVLDTFRETDQEAYLNGKRAVSLSVFRIGAQTPLAIAAAVKSYLAIKNETLPPGVQTTIWSDRSETYSDRIGLLMRNAYIGLGLVLLILGLFLDLRLAFWVTMGITAAFLGSLLLMTALDVTFNMISLFAFILAIGIVVDDAIVVGEAIYKHRQDGKGGLEAAIAGVREVVMPVTFAVLTTITAFIPLIFLPGTMGKFYAVIPVVVISIFALSLVESLFVLPAHLAHLRRNPKGILGLVRAAQRYFAEAVEWFTRRVFQPMVQLAIALRYLVIATGVAILIGTWGFLAAGNLPFTLMPQVEGDWATANVRLPVGAPFERTREIHTHLVQTAQETIAALGGDAYVRGVFAELGTSGANTARVRVYLVPAGDRPYSSSDFTREWRQRVGEPVGVEALNFRFNMGPRSADAPIQLELSHRDTHTLEEAAASLADALGTYNGVKDIDNGVARGKEQIDFKLRPEARSLGVSERTLARQVRSAFYGAEALRQQRGRDEVQVFARLPEAERTSPHTLETLLIRTPQGGEIPLRLAADFERGRAYTTIQRKNGRRILTVSAEIDDAVITADEVINDLQRNFVPDLLENTPGLSFALGGQQEEQAEIFAALGIFYTVALLVMFALMAVVFRSYIQPLIVMLAIPFGITGAVIGHVLLDYNLSLISILGMVALSGVVINNSLVMVSVTNDYRLQGLEPAAAVIAGAGRRFRPIILTTLTTFFGLSPMIFETSRQARFLIPMAISLGVGILFATWVILFLVPALTIMVDDCQRIARRMRQWVQGPNATTEPN